MKQAPPHARLAEEAVLGAVLLDESRESRQNLLQSLSPEDFYVPAHQCLWKSYLELQSRGEAIDLITVEAALGEAIAMFGDVQTISKLTDHYATRHHVRAHIQLIKRCSKRRQVIAHCRKLISNLQDDSLDESRPSDTAVYSEASETLRELSRTEGESGYLNSRELMQQTWDELKARHDGTRRLLSTGFPSLDEVVLGLEPGQQIVIGGRPKMGKSALATDILRHCARSETPGLMFSLEMAYPLVGRRLLASEGDLSGEAILQPDFIANMNRRKHESVHQQIEFDELNHPARPPSSSLVGAFDQVAKLPISVFSGRADLHRIVEVAQAWRADPKVFDPECSPQEPGLIIVDYLQLIDTPGKQSREQEISRLSRQLKLLAMELGVVILLLSQLNRQAENRDDRRPRMSDLRDSGAIEQDADGIWLVYRPWVYDKTVPPDRAEILVPAQREGVSGETVRIRFDGSRTRFREPPPK